MNSFSTVKVSVCLLVACISSAQEASTSTQYSAQSTISGLVGRGRVDLNMKARPTGMIDATTGTNLKVPNNVPETRSTVHTFYEKALGSLGLRRNQREVLSSKSMFKRDPAFNELEPFDSFAAKYDATHSREEVSITTEETLKLAQAVITPESWMADVKGLTDCSKTRFAGSIGSEKARDYLRAKLQSVGLSVNEQNTEVFIKEDGQFQFGEDGTKSHEVVNLVATLEGKAQAPGQELPVIVIGAHYDSRGRSLSNEENAPGADDNASGVAGVLAAARYIKAISDALGGLPCTVKFVLFGGAGVGTVGSDRFVRTLIEPNSRKNFVGAIILDQIGFKANEQTSPSNPTARLVMDTIRSVRGGIGEKIKGMIRSIGDIARKAAGKPHLAETFCNWFGSGSDHTPFLKHELPAVLLISRDYMSNPGKNSEKDVPEVLDPAQGALISQVAALGALDMGGVRSVQGENLRKLCATMAKRHQETGSDIDFGRKVTYDSHAKIVEDASGVVISAAKPKPLKEKQKLQRQWQQEWQQYKNSEKSPPKSDKRPQSAPLRVSNENNDGRTAGSAMQTQSQQQRQAAAGDQGSKKIPEMPKPYSPAGVSYASTPDGSLRTQGAKQTSQREAAGKYIPQPSTNQVNEQLAPKPNANDVQRQQQQNSRPDVAPKPYAPAGVSYASSPDGRPTSSSSASTNLGSSVSATHTNLAAQTQSKPQTPSGAETHRSGGKASGTFKPYAPDGVSYASSPDGRSKGEEKRENPGVVGRAYDPKSYVPSPPPPTVSQPPPRQESMPKPYAPPGMSYASSPDGRSSQFSKNDKSGANRPHGSAAQQNQQPSQQQQQLEQQQKEAQAGGNVAGLPQMPKPYTPPGVSYASSPDGRSITGTAQNPRVNLSASFAAKSNPHSDAMKHPKPHSPPTEPQSGAKSQPKPYAPSGVKYASSPDGKPISTPPETPSRGGQVSRAIGSPHPGGQQPSTQQGVTRGNGQVSTPPYRNQPSGRGGGGSSTVGATGSYPVALDKYEGRVKRPDGDGIPEALNAAARAASAASRAATNALRQKSQNTEGKFSAATAIPQRGAFSRQTFKGRDAQGSSTSPKFRSPGADNDNDDAIASKLRDAAMEARKSGGRALLGEEKYVQSSSSKSPAAETANQGPGSTSLASAIQSKTADQVDSKQKKEPETVNKSVASSTLNSSENSNTVPSKPTVVNKPSDRPPSPGSSPIDTRPQRGPGGSLRASQTSSPPRFSPSSPSPPSSPFQYPQPYNPFLQHMPKPYLPANAERMNSNVPIVHKSTGATVSTPPPGVPSRPSYHQQMPKSAVKPQAPMPNQPFPGHPSPAIAGNNPYVRNPPQRLNVQGSGIHGQLHSQPLNPSPSKASFNYNFVDKRSEQLRQQSPPLNENSRSLSPGGSASPRLQIPQPFNPFIQSSSQSMSPSPPREMTLAKPYAVKPPHTPFIANSEGEAYKSSQQSVRQYPFPVTAQMQQQFASPRKPIGNPSQSPIYPQVPQEYLSFPHAPAKKIETTGNVRPQAVMPSIGAGPSPYSGRSYPAPPPGFPGSPYISNSIPHEYSQISSAPHTPSSMKYKPNSNIPPHIPSPAIPAYGNAVPNIHQRPVSFSQPNSAPSMYERTRTSYFNGVPPQPPQYYSPQGKPGTGAFPQYTSQASKLPHSPQSVSHEPSKTNSFRPSHNLRPDHSNQVPISPPKAASPQPRSTKSFDANTREAPGAIEERRIDDHIRRLVKTMSAKRTKARKSDEEFQIEKVITISSEKQVEIEGLKERLRNESPSKIALENFDPTVDLVS